MRYPIINYTENYLIIVINVKAVIIVTADNENAADTVIKGTENDDNYINLTETKLTLFSNNAVLKNIKLKRVLIILL